MSAIVGLNVGIGGQRDHLTGREVQKAECFRRPLSFFFVVYFVCFVKISQRTAILGPGSIPRLHLARTGQRNEARTLYGDKSQLFRVASQTDDEGKPAAVRRPNETYDFPLFGQGDEARSVRGDESQTAFGRAKGDPSAGRRREIGEGRGEERRSRLWGRREGLFEFVG